MTNEAIVIKKVDLATIKASSCCEVLDRDAITFYRRDDGRIVTHRVVRFFHKLMVVIIPYTWR